MKKMILSITMISFLAACAENGRIDRGAAGAVTGGILGALAGSHVGKGSGRSIAIFGGAIAGSLIGSHVGQSLDENDKQRLAQNSRNTLEYAPSGQVNRWSNPDSGHSGTMRVDNTYQERGRYCREFTQTITVGGRTEEGYGKACRQPDGSWEIIS